MKRVKKTQKGSPLRRGLSSPFAGAGGEQGQAEANQAALVATHSVRCRIAPARGGAGSSPCGWHESQPQVGALHQRCEPGRIPAADELQECVAGGKLAPGRSLVPFDEEVFEVWSRQRGDGPR